MLDQEWNVRDLTAFLGISQAAVSQHLQVLKLADLVIERSQGRMSFYRTAPDQLRVVTDWLMKYQVFWEQKLDALEQHLAKKTN